MKIYFTASTSESAKKNEKYSTIIKFLNELGHTNTNYVHFPKNSPEYIKAEEILRETNVYDYQTSIINKSDVLLADITNPSITVGYQIDYAINRKIPIIAIYKKTKNFRLPVVLTHTHFGLLTIEKYDNTDDLKSLLKSSIENIKAGTIKFNFYINLQLHNYLTRRAEAENKNKSDIIREILESEIKHKPY